MKKVLIVGGAGYIGSHVNKLLSENGIKTVVFDNLSTGHKRLSCWGEFFKGDLARPADISNCFKKHEIASVMHFAAFTAVGESVCDPAKFYTNNVSNTINLLNVMRAAGVRRLVFSSSAAVYGEPLKVPITESHPLSPVNPYGRTKFMMEQVMRDYSAAYGLKYITLRYFNAAGADPDCRIGEMHNPETHLIPLILDAASGRKKQVNIFGDDYKTPDGTCLRDYVHVSDLANAHLLSLKHLAAGGESIAFNLGIGKGFSVLEVVKAAQKVTGRKIPVEIVPRRAGDPAALIASSAYIRRKLAWVPQYRSIETIIAHAWKWHQSVSV